MIKEFKPALLFLGKFLLIYFVSNILYGLFVESFDRKPDPITKLVTIQSAWVLERVGYDITVADHPTEPKVRLNNDQSTVLNVFEGCNGLNVMIVFVAFLFAFGGPGKVLAYFLPAGLIIIHLVNLLRINLLFYLSLHHPKQFYYYHKYFFTATLYLIVFTLWAIWVIRFNEKRNIKTRP
jgi:exosortase family protein XrtF